MIKVDDVVLVPSGKVGIITSITSVASTKLSVIHVRLDGEPFPYGYLPEHVRAANKREAAIFLAKRALGIEK